MTTQTSNRQPTHRLYIVKGDENARWIEIGAAWANRDGQGYTIQLDAIPATGRLVMREIASENGGQS